MAILQAVHARSAIVEEQDDLCGSPLPAEEAVMIPAGRAPARRKNITRHAAVLIPAWNPDHGLLQIVSELVAHGFGALIVVDDGSEAESATTFAQIEIIPSVYLLRHAVNLGKGRALKTGINFFLSELSFDVLVTADADGQHAVEDIVRVAEALETDPTRVALGARVFGKEIPLRSRFGNLLTRRIFGFVTGAALADTQTGLRAFPRHVLADLLALEGERYEYEMTVLAHICRNGARPVEIPIETIYLEGNRSSHFDPIRDSMRIYFVLLRFYFSSMLAAGLDFAGFSLAFAFTGNVFASVVFGRLSSLVNYAVNKRYVFQNEASLKGTMARYYMLVLAVGGLSYTLIWTLTARLHWNVFAAKLTVDVLLSLVSFSAQRTFVFRKHTAGRVAAPAASAPTAAPDYCSPVRTPAATQSPAAPR